MEQTGLRLNLELHNLTTSDSSIGKLPRPSASKLRMVRRALQTHTKVTEDPGLIFHGFDDVRYLPIERC